MLSTISSRPCSLAKAAQARRSVTFIMGLLGVSMYRALAAGVSTARILSRLVLSTKFTVRPFLALTVFSRRVVPPYRSSEQMI